MGDVLSIDGIPTAEGQKPVNLNVPKSLTPEEEAVIRGLEAQKDLSLSPNYSLTDQELDLANKRASETLIEDPNDPPFNVIEQTGKKVYYPLEKDYSFLDSINPFAATDAMADEPDIFSDTGDSEALGFLQETAAEDEADNKEDDSFSSPLDTSYSQIAPPTNSGSASQTSTTGRPTSQPSLTTTEVGGKQVPDIKISNYTPEFTGGQVSESEIYGLMANALEKDVPAEEAFTLADTLYKNANRENFDVNEVFAEIGAELKQTYGLTNHKPNYSSNLPPLSYSGFDSVDKKVEVINEWPAIAKHQLSLKMGSEYALNKLQIDAEIDSIAKNLKENVQARAKYGVDKEGKLKKEGQVSDVLARVGEGFVADTAHSLGLTSIQHAAEDFFVQNPSYDGELVSDIATTFGQVGGQVGIGLVVGAGTGFIGEAANVARLARIAPKLGTIAGAASGWSRDVQDVYESVYKETGSTKAATTASLMTLPGDALDFAADLFVLGKVMKPFTKFKSKAEKVKAMVEAIEKETDLNKLAKIKSILEQSKKGALAKIATAGKSATESAITEGITEGLQGAQSDYAISANVPSMKTTPSMFEGGFKSRDALIGAIVGGVAGGVGTGIEMGLSPEEGIRQIDEGIKRIDKRAAEMKQAAVTELTKNNPEDSKYDLSSITGKKPTVYDEPITPLRQAQNAFIASIFNEQKIREDNAALGFGVSPGDRANIKDQLKAAEDQVLASEKNLKIETLKDQLNQHQTMLGDLASKEQTPEVQALRSDLLSSMKDIASDLRKLTTPEKPITETAKTKESVKEDISTLEEKQKSLTDEYKDIVNKPKKEQDVARKKELRQQIQETTAQLNKLKEDLPSYGTEQPKTNEQLQAERLKSIDLNQAVDDLTPEEVNNQLDLLNKEADKLPENLQKRKADLVEQKQFNQALASEEDLNSQLDFGTDVQDLSPTEVAHEIEAITSHPGDLNEKQRARLEDLRLQEGLQTEQAINEKSLGNKPIKELNSAEVSKAIQVLKDNKEDLTQDQKDRLAELQKRKPALADVLTPEAYNDLPKLTRSIVPESETLSQAIERAARIRNPVNKAAVQEFIKAFDTPANVKYGNLTPIQRINQRLGKATTPEEVANLKGQKDRLLREERKFNRQVAQERVAEHVQAKEAVTRPKKTSRDVGDRTSGGEFQVEEHSGFLGAPNNPQTYADLYETQPDTVNQEDTIYAPIEPDTNQASPNIDLSKPTANSYAGMRQQYPRITAKKAKEGGPAKPAREILKRLGNISSIKLRYQKLSKSGSLLGAYFGKIGLGVTNLANDLETGGHELAHALDHEYGIAEDWIRSDTRFDDELEKFWVHGTPYKSIRGKRAEGVAEYIRAYLMDPEKTAALAPEFTAYVKERLPAEVQAELLGVHQDLSNFVSANGLDLLKNHIQTTEQASNEDSSVFNRLMGDNFSAGSVIPLAVQLKQHIGKDNLVDYAFDLAKKEIGFETGQIPADSNPTILTRGVRKLSSYIADALKHGIPNPERILANVAREGGTGLARLTDGGISWLFSDYTKGNEEVFLTEKADTLANLIAERTIEKGEPLVQQLQDLRQLPQTQEVQQQIVATERALKGITGASGQLLNLNDVQIAKDAIAKLKEDPERYDRLKAAGEKYRQWADANLKYLLAKGVISDQDYIAIKEGNKEYAAMFRIQEDSVTDYHESEVDFLRSWKGSTKRIKDPYTTLLQATHNAIRLADVNEAKSAFLDFTNPDRVNQVVAEGQLREELKQKGIELPANTLTKLAKTEIAKSPHEDYFGLYSQNEPTPKTSLGNIANRLLTRPESMDKVTTIYRNGVPEYWHFNDEFIHKQLNTSTSNTGASVPALNQIMRMFQYSVTHALGFVTRNPFKDVFHRSFVSDAGLGRSFKETFVRRGPMDASMLSQFKGDQQGALWRDEVDHARALRAMLQDEGFLKKSIFSAPRLWKKYENLVNESERTGRLSEFSASYEKAISQGADPFDARLIAASKAASIMDYTSSGDFMRFLNNFYPFVSAGSVGIRTTLNAVKNNPARSFAYFTALGLMPRLVERTMATLGGYKDEWDEQPDYIKDFFMNFKIGDNLWFRLPMSYEMGLMSNLSNRYMDWMEGKPHSFDGAAGDAFQAFSPLDPLDVGNPLLSLYKVESNYDKFRQQPIVPVYDEDKKLSLRKFPEHSSVVGKQVMKGLINFGVDDNYFARKYGDARKIDYLFQEITGSLGRDVVGLPDLAAADKRGRYLKTLGGLFTETPAYNAEDPKFVRSFITIEGLSSQNKAFQNFFNLQEKYFNAETAADKDAAAKRYRDEAARLRKIMDSKGGDAFRSPKTILKNKQRAKERENQ